MPAQADGEVTRVDLAQQKRQADDPGKDGRKRRPSDTHCGYGAPAQDKNRVQDDVENHVQHRIPKWRNRIPYAAQ